MTKKCEKCGGPQSSYAKNGDGQKRWYCEACDGLRIRAGKLTDKELLDGLVYGIIDKLIAYDEGKVLENEILNRMKDKGPIQLQTGSVTIEMKPLKAEGTMDVDFVQEAFGKSFSNEDIHKIFWDNSMLKQTDAEMRCQLAWQHKSDGLDYRTFREHWMRADERKERLCHGAWMATIGTMNREPTYEIFREKYMEQRRAKDDRIQASGGTCHHCPRNRAPH